MAYIKHLTIENLWDRYKIDCELDRQVNILFGYNGSGKTTVLKEIEALYEIGKSRYGFKTTLTLENETKGTKSFIPPIISNYPVNLISISTFDNAIEETQSGATNLISLKDFAEKKQTPKESPLLQTLNSLVYGNGNAHSQHFEKYRAQRLDLLDAGNEEEANNITNHILAFYNIINEFFAPSGKKLVYKKQEMYCEYLNEKFENQRVELSQLSAGEKQLLIIFIKVLLCGTKPSIILLDEPEISLHITWQRMLIEKILTLKPHCQLIIATHSPSVFGSGWMDKVIRMEDILKPINVK